ncbi:GMC family oxidoreductase N-terminal domain-containing protein [Novosphingobium sp.]|uniref:GMC family oxidoreductase n=1 Tax=Novosphingobium sp. TaxID=1874826 RepID=UPI00333ED595
MESFDYIIIGAGSAGCVLADSLSQNPNTRVLLLEAGGSDRDFWIRMPIGYGHTFYDARVNWRFRSDPVPGLDGRTAYLPRGKVIGGSSSINAMVYCRGLASDFDDWAAAGNPGWGWGDVAPVFDAFEHHVDADGSSHGAGPLWVSHREPECHPLKQHFFRAGEQAGLPRRDDLPPLGDEGVFPYAITTRDGLRCSSADAFLHPARRRHNLEVRSHVLVERVVFAGQRATGVAVRGKGGTQTITALGEVIVAAGGVGSPVLLQRSGIGPAPLLQGLGLPVVKANHAVGRNLQDHLGINYLYRANEPTLNAVLGSWPGRIAAGIRYVLRRSGPLSLSINQIGGMARTRPDLARPDVQLYFNPLSYSTETVGKRELTKPDPWPGFIIGHNSCRPTSRGWIALRSADPHDAPLIQPNYLDTAQDRSDVVAAARLIGRIAATPAMADLITARAFDIDAASDAEIVDDFKARSGTVHHLCGTCKMAPEADGGVVDATLRVYGVDGLRVVDASIFPNITSANTNAPTIMVARKAADLIRAN